MLVLRRSNPSPPDPYLAAMPRIQGIRASEYAQKNQRAHVTRCRSNFGLICVVVGCAEGSEGEVLLRQVVRPICNPSPPTTSRILTVRRPEQHQKNQHSSYTHRNINFSRKRIVVGGAGGSEGLEGWSPSLAVKLHLRTPTLSQHHGA